jgi:hypothetical protein
MRDLDRHVLEHDSNFKAIGKRVTDGRAQNPVFAGKLSSRGYQASERSRVSGGRGWICHHFHDKNAHCKGVLVIVCDLGSAVPKGLRLVLRSPHCSQARHELFVTLYGRSTRACSWYCFLFLPGRMANAPKDRVLTSWLESLKD